MHGLFAAFGEGTKALKRPSWPLAAEVQSAECWSGRIERFSPAGQPLPAWNAAGPDGAVQVCIDGYLLVDSIAPERGQDAHLAAFARNVETHDITHALQSVVYGSFVLIAAHADGRVAAVTDTLGTIPLYVAEVEDGFIVSTNPVLLAGCAGVDRTPDRTGLASWALVGYTVGSRYLVRGIQMVPVASIFERNPDGRLEQRSTPVTPFRHEPDPRLNLDDLVAAFRQSCSRLAALDEPTAHLQSAGMDSRFILASWPAGLPLPCYGYGDPDSSEVRVARQLAAVRGSTYRHSAPDGDAVAAVLDEIFAANGLLVYPDRYLISATMAGDGYRRVLDGFAGGFMLGGAFYKPPRSVGGTLAHALGRIRNRPIGSLNLDEMTQTVYDAIGELPNPAVLDGIVSDDYLAELDDSRQGILSDIHAELERLWPESVSAAMLVHNFTISNRSAHGVSQQGVMSRRALVAGYPFSSDTDFLKLTLRIPPERAAFKRLYIELFRAHYPAYADVPLGDSLIPARRPAQLHKLSGLLVRRGLHVPGVSGRGYRPANNWQRWLRESPALRDGLAASLRSGGIDAPGLDAAMSSLGTGARGGFGKLMHLAAIGRWLGLAVQ